MSKVDTKNTVFIIDGSSFLYRAYYSIRPLHDPTGRPVQAVYGFCRMIKKLVDTFKPNCLVVVWDSPGKTERHEIYTAYKETRQAMPSDLSEQKALIKKFNDLIGLVQIAVPGIEADDLMYSMTKELEAQNIKSVLVTSDKDMGQALTEYTQIFDPFKDTFITREALEQKLEFPLSKLSFYYALVGDSSDNIPGVRGIGPKGAQDIVKKFESLEDLYKNLNQVSERTRQLLVDSESNAYLSQKLFTLRYHNLQTTLASCTYNPENWERARDFFRELNFKSLIKQSESEAGQQQSINKPVLNDLKKYKFITVNTQDKLEALCTEIKEKKFFAIDTETTGLTIYPGCLVGISICTTKGHAYYVPFGHITIEQQLSRALVFDQLKPIFEDNNIKKYLHHAKFDAHVLYSEKIKLRGIAFDTMIAASLLVGDGQRIGLKYLSEYYLQEPMLEFSSIVNKSNYKNFSYVPLELATQYAAADAHQTLQLYEKFSKGLEDLQMRELFEQIEMPLLSVLLEMEHEGIILDLEIIKAIDQRVSSELSQLRVQIIDLIGHEFADINLNSPKQLGELLFVHLKLPTIKKTTQKTAYSTDQEVLRDLAKIHPVPALIARYRELFKIKSTYLDALGEYVNPASGRIHTTYSQTGVATGRLSSSEPNLQNIPVDRFHIRSAFKAPENGIFLSADYSQIELRVLAYLSQDKRLIQAFNEKEDIHALTAAGLFNVNLTEVTHEQRQLGKRINFSILYGLTAHGLSKDLEISHGTAREYIEKFMAQYPGVSHWMEWVVAQVTDKGYVTTHWGRRRYLPGIYEKNKTLYDLAKRVAINTKAQGTAADIMKIGMINLDAALHKNRLTSKILLQIHDELLIQVPESESEYVEALTKQVLQTVTPDWNVPLEVTTRKGKSWQDVTK